MNAFDDRKVPDEKPNEKETAVGPAFETEKMRPIKRISTAEALQQSRNQNKAHDSERSTQISDAGKGQPQKYTWHTTIKWALLWLLLIANVLVYTGAYRVIFRLGPPWAFQ